MNNSTYNIIAVIAGIAILAAGFALIGIIGYILNFVGGVAIGYGGVNLLASLWT
jgi:hypothetical protein